MLEQEQKEHRINLNQGERRARQPLISPADIDDLRRKGYNQSQIAEMYGCTRAYISWVKKTYGAAYEQPRAVARRNMPSWNLTAGQGRSSLYTWLGSHLEYMETAGHGMSQNKLYRLRLFYLRLERNGEIVEYDPEFGPSRSVGAGGFRFLPRTSEDAPRMIIRQNAYTVLTDEGRVVWQIPHELPTSTCE